MGIHKVNKAIFLDRDGILNQTILIDNKPHPPFFIKDVETVKDAAFMSRYLHRLGYKLIVVTNQPDVARGHQTKEVVELINTYIQFQLPWITEFYMCYHDNNDGCTCRKPQAGMLFKAIDKYGLDPNKCWMIGDRWSDIEAGSMAGVKTIFMDYNYNEKRPTNQDFTITELIQIKEIILD